MSIRISVFTCLLLLLAVSAVAQSSAPRSVDSRIAAAARGWAALADRRPADALEAVRGLLQAEPGNHQAVAVVLEAHRQAGSPEAGLDAYEAWSGVTRHEDLFLLRTIALSVLDALSGASEPRLKAKSLAVLVSQRETRATAGQAAAGESLLLELGKAVEGDSLAAASLQTKLLDPQTRSRFEALEDPASDAVVPSAVVIKLLKDAEPITRAAAAEALGRRSERDASAALREALEDRTGLVRLRASFALARLGDPEQLAAVRQIVAEDTGETVVLAARVLADTGNTGWEHFVRPVLSDPNPMARLAAADLLVGHDSYRHEAMGVLLAGSEAENPLVQQQAASSLAPALAGAGDIAGLRRLLKSPTPWVRHYAATALAQMSHGDTAK